jgi:hypothetical protein
LALALVFVLHTKARENPDLASTGWRGIKSLPTLEAVLSFSYAVAFNQVTAFTVVIILRHWPAGI